MAISYATATRNSRVAQISTDVGASGLLRIYAGSIPANAAASVGTPTTLATLTCSSTFGTATTGVLTSNTITQDGNAAGTGTAAFFRILKSDATTCIVQGTCTATGGGGDMTMASTTITAGTVVSLSGNALTITEGSN